MTPHADACNRVMVKHVMVVSVVVTASRPKAMDSHSSRRRQLSVSIPARHLTVLRTRTTVSRVGFGAIYPGLGDHSRKAVNYLSF
jgi:hypothetical protein